MPDQEAGHYVTICVYVHGTKALAQMLASFGEAGELLCATERVFGRHLVQAHGPGNPVLHLKPPLSSVLGLDVTIRGPVHSARQHMARSLLKATFKPVDAC